MKKTKLIAAVFALVMAGGATSTFPQYMPDNALTADAATTYENYTEDGIKYEVFSDHAAVIGHEKSTSALAGVLEIPAEIKGVPVTEIRAESPFSINPKYPFRGYSNLSGLVIPDSVKTIGTKAFSGCSGLVNVKFGNNVEEIGLSAFYGCSSIKKLELPSSLKTIGNEAFESCSKITELTIPDSVTKMGSTCFASCSNLTNATIGKGVTAIPWHGFSGCSKLNKVEFNGTIDSIGGYAFNSCGFETFTVPDTVNEIGNSAFYGCSNLVSANLGNGLKTLEAYAFGSCKNLKTIKFSPKLSTINGYAFDRCSVLEEVNLPASISSIGDNAFEFCTKLKSVTIPNKDCIIFDSDSTLGGYTDQTVIYGVKGSYAEEHANEVGYKFIEIADTPTPVTTTTTTAKKTTITTTTTTKKTTTTSTTTKKVTATTTTTTTKPVVDPVVSYNPKMGDPSGDGKIDAIDASIVLNVYAKLATTKTQATKDEIAYCDVNKDGKVNAIDASYVLSYYAYISTFKGSENDKVDFVTFVMNT